MKKFIIASMIASMMAISAVSFADESSKLKVGGQFDIGAPSGMALGVVVKPKLNWLRLDLAGTYNSEFGLRIGGTFDPIKFPISPTFTIQAGHTFDSKVPGISKSPELGMNYVDFHLGLEVGNRDRWRFFLHAGPSYVSVRTDGFQDTLSVGKGVSIGNPEFHGWVSTAALGFALYF
jgi:hypothetical protein